MVSKDNRDPEQLGNYLLDLKNQLSKRFNQNIPLAEVASMYEKSFVSIGGAEAGNLIGGDARTNGKVMKGEGVVSEGEN